jgi:hypothetical protein
MSGIASRGRTVGYKTTETASVPRHEFVERVEVAARVDRAESAGNRLRQTYRSEKRDTSACIAGNQ